jgi:hypothetical protein
MDNRLGILGVHKLRCGYFLREFGYLHGRSELVELFSLHVVA